MSVMVTCLRSCGKCIIQLVGRVSCDNEELMVEQTGIANSMTNSSEVLSARCMTDVFL